MNFISFKGAPSVLPSLLVDLLLLCFPDEPRDGLSSHSEGLSAQWAGTGVWGPLWVLERQTQELCPQLQKPTALEAVSQLKSTFVVCNRWLLSFR